LDKDFSQWIWDRGWILDFLPGSYF